MSESVIFVAREPSPIEIFDGFEAWHVHWAMHTTWWHAAETDEHLYGLAQIDPRLPRQVVSLLAPAPHYAGVLPCDPRGSVLMGGDLGGFLEAATGNVAHYGKHGLRAFMATWHGVIQRTDGRVVVPWSASTWDEVNLLLDEFDERGKGPHPRAEKADPGAGTKLYVWPEISQSDLREAIKGGSYA